MIPRPRADCGSGLWELLGHAVPARGLSRNCASLVVWRPRRVGVRGGAGLGGFLRSRCRLRRCGRLRQVHGSLDGVPGGLPGGPWRLQPIFFFTDLVFLKLGNPGFSKPGSCISPIGLGGPRNYTHIGAADINLVIPFIPISSFGVAPKGPMDGLYALWAVL